jgi:hypothetical protein
MNMGASRLRAPVDLVEPSADGEVDLARFLLSTVTVREIADKLCGSQNTLKFRLRGVHPGLGVSSRDRAGEVPRRIVVAR